MAYTYRGNVHDANEPLPTPIRPRKLHSFDPGACGTYAGYRRHQTHNVPACQGCKDAMAAYSRDRYQPKERKTFRADACGTWAGWHRHNYYNIPACEPCKDAAREYQRHYRATRKAAA